MESEKKNYCSKYLKVVMAVLLAAALFYSGMKDYVKVGKTVWRLSCSKPGEADLGKLSK